MSHFWPESVELRIPGQEPGCQIYWNVGASSTTVNNPLHLRTDSKLSGLTCIAGRAAATVSTISFWTRGARNCKPSRSCQSTGAWCRAFCGAWHLPDFRPRNLILSARTTSGNYSSPDWCDEAIPLGFL